MITALCKRAAHSYKLFHKLFYKLIRAPTIARAQIFGTDFNPRQKICSKICAMGSHYRIFSLRFKTAFKLNMNEVVETITLVILAVSSIILNRRKRRVAERDHRSLPRGKRTKFSHRRAAICIHQDFLGPVPRWSNQEFRIEFRISRRMFEKLAQQLVPMTPFYQTKGECTVAAKIMIALKALGFGCSPRAFRAYFQMSGTLADVSYVTFCRQVPLLYTREYLQTPSSLDIGRILALHKRVHGVDGMLGSIDCTHVRWKNCRKAHHSAFQGNYHRQNIYYCTVNIAVVIIAFLMSRCKASSNGGSRGYG